MPTVISRNDILILEDLADLTAEHNPLVSNALRNLLQSHYDQRNFKLQECQPSESKDRDVEVVSELIYRSECPFGMGYDYWIDMGAAAHVWNTVIASPKEMIKCIAHHLKVDGYDDECREFFWKEVMHQCKGPHHNLFIHVEGETEEEVKDALLKFTYSFIGKAPDHQSEGLNSLYLPRSN